MSMKREDHSELCGMLDRLTPGFLPPDVFRSVARLMVTATFVVVPLILRDGRLWARLHAREANDQFYPGMLNTPGTVIRSSDEDLTSAYKRLLETELLGVPIRQGPVFVDHAYDLIVRGREISLIHWVELNQDVSQQDLFDVTMLPEAVIPTDRPRIEKAASHFQAFGCNEKARS